MIRNIFEMCVPTFQEVSALTGVDILLRKMFSSEMSSEQTSQTDVTPLADFTTYGSYLKYVVPM